jgi:ABC-2 type transport system ATP-binding protein
MDAQLQSASADLKNVIGADTADGGAELVSFANAYAVTPKLKHRAIILRLNLGQATDDSQRGPIEQEMLALVDDIVEDHEAKSDSSEIKAQTEARQRARAYYLKTPPPNDSAVIARGLAKGYPGTEFRLAGVDLDLHLGEITGVVGQNAHGKTTLLRMIAGELRPDAGSLEYPLQDQHGANIDWVRVKADIAYLPQELPPWSGSLEDGLRYNAALHGILGKNNDREVDYIVERLGLAEHLDKRWEQLSGGYKLRFSLAGVLVWKPRLLIMDEPLANLDVRAQTNLLQDIRDLAASYRHPMAVLMSSQHLHEVEAVSERIVFLREGKVIFSGPMSDVGADRHYNAYELGSSLSLADLSERLSSSPVTDLHFNGVTFVLKTSLETDYRELLQTLLELGVDVEYFRDISRSTKQLFV